MLLLKDILLGNDIGFLCGENTIRQGNIEFVILPENVTWHFSDWPLINERCPINELIFCKWTYNLDDGTEIFIGELATIKVPPSCVRFIEQK